MNKKLIFFILLFFILFSCNQKKESTLFSFHENNEGIELSEDGKPIMFYQKLPKALDNKYVCSNYIHPLYSLDGDTLTEEAPVDHPHHRGIFWAWHQIYINGENIGDGWIMENISQEVKTVKTSLSETAAQLDANVLWKSINFKNETPFIEENTKITFHKSQPNLRFIDFEIALKGLTTGVEIGGSADEKGYGGFCTRIKMPDDLLFISDNKEVIPQTLQIAAGSWMDFSGSIEGEGKISGVSILCHPTTPNYPAPWILRAKSSMQNIVFPGQQRVEIPTDKPIVLRYRLVIHKSDAFENDIAKLQEEFEKTSWQ